MGMDYEGAQKTFRNIINNLQPWLLSNFVMWLDLKVAEFKVIGSMKLENDWTTKEVIESLTSSTDLGEFHQTYNVEVSQSVVPVPDSFPHRNIPFRKKEGKTKSFQTVQSSNWHSPEVFNNKKRCDKRNKRLGIHIESGKLRPEQQELHRNRSCTAVGPKQPLSEVQVYTDNNIQNQSQPSLQKTALRNRNVAAVQRSGMNKRKRIVVETDSPISSPHLSHNHVNNSSMSEQESFVVKRESDDEVMHVNFGSEAAVELAKSVTMATSAMPVHSAISERNREMDMENSLQHSASSPAHSESLSSIPKLNQMLQSIHSQFVDPEVTAETADPKTGCNKTTWSDEEVQQGETTVNGNKEILMKEIYKHGDVLNKSVDSAQQVDTGQTRAAELPNYLQTSLSKKKRRAMKEENLPQEYKEKRLMKFIEKMHFYYPGVEVIDDMTLLCVCGTRVKLGRPRMLHNYNKYHLRKCPYTPALYQATPDFRADLSTALDKSVSNNMESNNGDVANHATEIHGSSTSEDFIIEVDPDDESISEVSAIATSEYGNGSVFPGFQSASSDGTLSDHVTGNNSDSKMNSGGHGNSSVFPDVKIMQCAKGNSERSDPVTDS